MNEFENVELTPEEIEELRELVPGGSELHLDKTDKGITRANLNNAIQLIEHNPTTLGTIQFDEFLQRIVSDGREWSDVDDLRLTRYLQRDCGVPSITPIIIAQAVLMVAHRNKVNSVKDWMSSVLWDRIPRIDQFFSDHFGARADVYTMAASRNFWISMVARTYKPGCQADNMVVFEGPQGIGKSRALRAIGGDWYAEQHESASNPKAFAEIIQGKLLIEISEMDSFNRAEVARVKQIITNTKDRFRESYARRAQDYPRRGIFAGTTNRDDWNRDETGARRFWPIACKGEIDVHSIISTRDQLFAEAVHEFQAGKTWWEMPSQETIDEQKKRYDADTWADMIREFVAPKSSVRLEEILIDLLKFEPKECDKRNQMRVSTSLRSIGWRRATVREGNTVLKKWLAPEVE